jgi:hypothetical protein
MLLQLLTDLQRIGATSPGTVLLRGATQDQLHQ